MYTYICVHVCVSALYLQKMKHTIMCHLLLNKHYRIMDLVLLSYLETTN